MEQSKVRKGRQCRSCGDTIIATAEEIKEHWENCEIRKSECYFCKDIIKDTIEGLRRHRKECREKKKKAA